MPHVVNLPNSQANLSDLLRPVYEWGKYGMEKERHKVEVARAEATTRSIEEEMGLRQQDSRRADERLNLERRDTARLEGESAQRRALVGRELSDEASQRRAALQAFWPEAQAAARKDPELGQFLVRTLTSASQLKPDDQLRYLEEQQAIFSGMVAQKDRDSLADELERGRQLGEFTSPNWDQVAPKGPDGKPMEDPQAKEIAGAIQALRSGRADPKAVRESVNAIRIEGAKELFEVARRQDLAQQGIEARQGLIKGGLKSTHPLIQGIDQLNAFFAKSLMSPEKYADKLIELTTGRKVVSGEDPQAEMVKDLTREFVMEGVPTGELGDDGKPARRQVSYAEAEALAMERVQPSPPTPPPPRSAMMPSRRNVLTSGQNEAATPQAHPVLETAPLPMVPAQAEPVKRGTRSVDPVSDPGAAVRPDPGTIWPSEAPPPKRGPAVQGVKPQAGKRRSRTEILGGDKGPEQDPAPLREAVAKAIALGIPLDQFQDIYGIDLNTLTEEDLREIEAMTGKRRKPKKP